MRKVTKILLKVLSVTLLFLIFCPIVLTLVVSLPSVQNYAVDKAAGFISEKLGTHVAIDRVRFGVLGSLRVDGLYVEDYQHDTLLYAGSVKVNLARIPDLSGLSLRNGVMSNVTLNLRETPDGVMNIKQVVDSIRRDKTPEPKSFALSIDNTRLDNVTVVIERQEHREPGYGVDYGDMHIKHISAFVDSFFFENGVVGGHIRNLSAVEQCGFMVQNCTGHFYVDKGVVGFKDFDVMSEKSDVRLRSFVMTGESWDDYKDFINKVTMEGEAYRSAVSTDDIAHFAPRLLPWKLAARNIDVSVDGTVADLAIDVDNVTFGSESTLMGEVSFRGLPKVNTAGMSVNLQKLATNGPDMNMLLSSITGRPLPDVVQQITGAAGDMIAAGTFNGGMRAFTTDVDLVTQAGNVALAAQFENMGAKKIIDDMGVERISPATSVLEADASLRHLNIGTLLGKDILGRTNATIHFGGVNSQSGMRGQLRAEVAALEFNKADYSNLWLEGVVDNKSFSGELSSEAAPIDFALRGKADLNGEKPVYDFRLRVDDADLMAMNINHRDSLSRLSFDAELYAVGRNLDEMSGTLDISNALYCYNVDTITTNNIRLISQSSEERRQLNLSSDYVEASFTGSTSYADLGSYMKSAMRKYLPNLATDKDLYIHRDDEHGGYSALSLQVKNIDPLLNAVARGVHIANGSTLNFTMNPMTNHLLLRAESEYVEMNNTLIANIDVDITNQGDSLAMYVQSEDLYMGAIHLPQLAILGGAKNNRVVMSAGFSDPSRNLDGGVSVMARLRRADIDKKPQVDLFISPSTINTGDKQWHITSGGVTIDSTRIVVDDFMIRSAHQMLKLDGVASRYSKDSLRVEMRDFEIEPFMGFPLRLGYSVKGLASGQATMQAVLNRGELEADLRIDSMTVNKTPVAPLGINSWWDFEQQRVRVKVKNLDTQGDIITGYYAPDSKRYYAEGVFDHIPLLMLDPALSGVVSQTEGEAFGKLEIMGQGRMAKLNGVIDVENASTMVDYTRVRYSIPKGRVIVKDNHFIANSVRVYDPERNTGQFNMDLSLEHLSNIAFNMRLVPRNMLVMNTTLQDNDLFYGKIYASGVATINGSKKGTTLDLVGTTEGNSQFFMPLSGKSDAANADFVVFEQPGMTIDTTNYLMRKKMMYERRHTTTTSSGTMDINLDLTVTDNAEAQLVIDPTVGDVIKGRGNGTLSMRIVPSANIFDMYGDYTITDGSYLFTLQNIINKRFLIESGSTITWTGDPMDARLNIDAIYKLKASLQPLLSSTTLDNVTRAVPVECIINLTERLSNPTVTFDIRVPNADSEIQNAVSNLLNNQQSIATQFMYLLVSGAFYSDSSTTSSMGATASATTGFELLSNQLSNWLSSDDYNIILRYRPKSELTSDEIDIGFSKSLINDRLLVEVEGNYLVDNKMAQSSNMSNFMGEAYITWLIDRAGALKMRGFTQTIDRFDENQGLQETGVGIYYKEDFNNWKDLKRRTRERFMSKRRREREALQREAQDSLRGMGNELRQVGVEIE